MDIHSNPIPVLHEHYGVSLHEIHRAVGIPRLAVDRLHSWHNMTKLSAPIHARLFRVSMVEWGAAKHDGYKTREQLRLLWECYFPETPPHIYHYLVFVHMIPDDTICKVTGYSDKTLAKIVKQPKLLKPQLERIGKWAVAYIEELSSKKRKAGPDPRYMALHRALRDPKRIYAKGEMIAD